MKKFLIMASILWCAALSNAQGLFTFSNFALTPAAPIFVDVVGGPTKAGVGYSVDYVYAKQPNINNASLLDVEGGTRSLTGTSGIFSGGDVTVPNYVGIISLQIRAWLTADGATYSAASISGHTGASTIMQVSLGNPDAIPPGTATSLEGKLSSFAVTASAVPEPSTIALGVMGLSVLLFRRRK